MGGFLRRRPRREAAAVATAIVMVATSLAAVRIATNADATSGGAHNPYEVPTAVDDNPASGVFETTITANETPAADIGLGGGKTANVLTFNGTIPGPEIRVNVNDTVIVHFVNDLATPTGIHWHGIELDNASDGTPLTQNMVEPNHKFLYKFKVIRAGVYWYHPHHHSSTNQVFKGLYGSLIVTDPAEATLQANGTLPPQANTRTLVLGDITVCKPPAGNDAKTYPYSPGSSPPWAGGGDLPEQQPPTPTTLCDTPIDEKGRKIEASGDPEVDGDGPAVPLAEGDVPNIQRKSGNSNEGQMVLTNGKNVGGRDGSPEAPLGLKPGAATLPVVAGQGQRFQVVNTANLRYFRLKLTGNTGTPIPLVRVGGEGGLLDSAVKDGGTFGSFTFDYEQGEIVIGPGERADVVAAIPASETGTATLWTLDFKRFGNAPFFSKIPTVPVAHLAITGPPASSPYSIDAGTPLLTNPDVSRSTAVLGAPTGGFITPAGGFTNPSGPKAGMNDPDISLNAHGSGGDTFINEVKGTHDFEGVDYTVAPKSGSTRYAASIGDTLELTVSNTTSAHHPFHPHGFSMQPLTFSQPELPAAGSVVYTFPPEFVDTVDIPGHTTLKYKVKLDDRTLMDGVTMGGGTGRWVMHCHIFFHAVFGMISEIIVTDGTGNERPYVNADDVETAEVNKGGAVATMHGTFHDIEGDAVTLTASKGTIVDNGDGTYDWSYTTDNSPGQGGLVYITATDVGGKKDQAAFELLVHNEPPDLAPIADKASNEGGVVNVSSTFTDADAGDTHTGTIDWGDGTGPQPATIAEGSPGTLSGSHVYGDDGTFHATATVSDGDDSDSESFDVVVSNVNPDGNINKTGTVLVNGVPTFFVDASQAQAFMARITDPGSDDLITSWDWGDGAPSPDETQTSYANGISPDPDPSPDVNPRDINHNTAHAFADACFYTVTFASADDDAGTDSDSVNVVVTGTNTKGRNSGWWQARYHNTDHWFTAAQIACQLKIANYMSAVFSEQRPALTMAQAYDVLHVTGGDDREKLDAELLAGWLNLANGGVDLLDKFDSKGKESPLGQTFFAIMTQAENVRNTPTSTKAQLKDQTSLLNKISTFDNA
jgi:FtsP/CotA-like multicopper oxidase with cupredoxin domain